MPPRPVPGRLVALALLLTAGCSGSAPRMRPGAGRGLEAPDAVIDVSASRAPPCRFGAADVAELSSRGDRDAEGDDAHSIRATFVLLSNAPEASTAPLDERVRAVVDADTGALLLTSELARDAVVLEGVSANELLARPGAILAGDVRAAFPRDISVRVALRSERPGSRRAGPGSSAREPAPREVVAVGLVLRRDGAGGLESTLELARGEREIVLLARRLPSAPRRLAFVVRSPFSTTNGPGAPWLALAVEVAPSPASPRAIAELDASLAAERAGERGAPPAPARDRRDAAPIDIAVLRARFAAAPRETLAWLGRREDAVVALEAALTLPESEFRLVAKGIERALAGRAAGAGAPSRDALPPLGLEVDLAALEVLLSPELRASARELVERLFGAAFTPDLADAPAPLFPRARLAKDRKAFERLVVLSNLVALDSSRPYERVRAARLLEPLAPGLEGYDPFGTFDGRSESVGRLWTRLEPEESRP